MDAVDKSLLAAFINKINKKMDPVGYATNQQAKLVYAKALAFAYSSENDSGSMADSSKKVITKIIPRMIASRSTLYKIVEGKNPDDPALRAMLQAKKDMPELFSECDDAILLGLVHWKRNTHKRQLQDFESYIETLNSQKSIFISNDTKDKKPQLEISVADLKAIALKKYNYWNPNPFNPTGAFAGVLHYVSKHYVFSIEHLTDADSRGLCTGMLFFNPTHPNHTADPELTLDPDKEWHRELVRKVIDRENIFLANLYYYLINNDAEQTMRLSRPKTETPNSSIPVGIFTGVTDALSNGVLTFKKKETQDNTPEDPKVTAEKQKALEEAAAKKKAEAEKEEQRLKSLKEKEAAALKLEEEKKLAEEKRKQKAEEILKDIQDKKRREEEERKTKEEAEAAFKTAEEKQRAAKLKALAESSSPTSSTVVTPPAAVNSSTPASVEAVPKLEQNPEDTCGCGSTKKYKNCCKKKVTPSGSPQRP